MRGLTLYVRRHMYNIHAYIYTYVQHTCLHYILTLYVRSRVVRNAKTMEKPDKAKWYQESLIHIHKKKNT